MNNLDKFLAKADGETLEQHNEWLNKVLDNILDVYDIKNENKIRKCIKNHDLGKVVSSFQDDITSTHRNVRHEILSASLKDLEDDERLAIITHHKELENLRSVLDNEYYQSELEEMKSILDVETDDVMEFIKKINKFSGRKITQNLDNILLKGYLQYCDHMGSSHNFKIDKGFNAFESYRFPSYNSIQEQIQQVKKGEDVMIVAPCGLGKTATAMFYSDIQQNKNKSKRIYYLLPLISCINSIYKDMNENEMSVGMLHSKAEYFLDKMGIDDDYKLLQKSVKQINVCTIYQIIKAIFSCKRFEMLLSQMKNSIFIVDEIHCFDIEQLALLLEALKFLKDNLGIRICIMSASIPTIQQNLIKEKLGIDKVVYAEKQDYKIRHRIYKVEKNIEDDLDKIKDDLDNGKKIILCVNTVDKAQELYDKLEQYKPCMIHGRYNTRSRELQEKRLKEKDTQLLIGTQAIEVSLDISFDKMYTEIAPFDALQQRFGRINRRGEKEDLGEIFIYKCDKTVYNKDIIENTDKVIKMIIENDDRIVLESKTQQYLDMVYTTLDMDNYNKIASNIKMLIKNLKIATYNKNVTEDMCGNDTIQVIPSSLFEEYKRLYKVNKLEARSLLVNINKRKKYDERVIWNEEYYIYVAEYKYSDEKGLEFESDIFL